MNYTDKYLIHDISNKAFKRKYRVKKDKWPRRERISNALKGLPLRVYPILPEDQAHLDSIKEELVLSRP